MSTQTISAIATIYIELLEMQAGIFNNAFKGINDSDAMLRPNDKVNHINWLLGHLTTCRFMLYNLLGGNETDPHFNLYFKPISSSANYPDLQTTKSNWERITKLLLCKVESFSDDEMEKELPGKDGRPKDFLSFFIYHEAYHLGQIGYARKFLGLPVLKSN